MRKHLYIVFLLLAIFACRDRDAEQLLRPLVPDTGEIPTGMVLIPAGIDFA